MKIELLNTGTELLLGSVANSHLSWIGNSLLSLGLRISQQTAVPDGPAIRDALCEAKNRHPDILIVTGGLGPTSDDVTREICAELLDLPLEQDPATAEHIRERFSKRGISLTEPILRQALVPRGASVLPNQNGTAPGLHFPKNLKPGWPEIFLLPGPPRELQPMFENSVAPLLRSRISSDLTARTYRVVGMGESAVEEIIGRHIELQGILEVGYCARLNEVDFRLVGTPSALTRWHDRILATLGENLVSTSQESLESVVVRSLAEQNATLAVAESCTGGQIASRITDVPGASAVFLAGFVTYANSAKTSQLHVGEKLLENFGAVSAPVAKAMAEGALLASGATYALSTTGIAGPGGGSPEKPQGTIFFGLAARGEETAVWQACYPYDRNAFKQVASQTALDALRRKLRTSQK